MFEATPKGALEFTKFCVCLIFTWPPWPEASKLAKTLFNIFSWSSVILPSLLAIALLNAARFQMDDYLVLTKNVCLAFSCIQLVIKILICRKHRPRLEMLHCGMKDFIENATPREMALLQRYVDRCATLHFIVNLFALLAGLTMISGPLMLPVKLPSDAKYPFPVDAHPGYEIAYLHFIVAGLQCSSITPVECHAALLIWFAGARLELLGEEFQNVTSSDEFNECIKKHQILLKDTDEMIRVVRLIVVTSTLMAGLSIITGAIHIVSHEPMVIKAQFIIIDGDFALVLFISAWPAENLINVSNGIGQGAYSCPWIQNSPEMRKNVLFVMQRSQMQCIISVPGILPQHSLESYTSMLHRTVDDFLAKATPRELQKLQEYASRCSLFHVAINLCALLSNIAMICGPLILPQPLPVIVEYPFAVDYSPALELAYIHQAIVGFQCASIGSVDCQTSLLIWFAGARLELLAEEFENASSVRQFDECIQKHQILLSYAEETIRATRSIVVTTIFSTILSVITAAVQLVTPQPLIVKSQFVGIFGGFLAELFISAWPAENLINMCDAIGQGAYNSQWTDHSLQQRQKILLVMLRSQIHNSISIPGLVPKLSLSYYASFVSRTYSFFTALRVIIDKLKF
ncbi:uncharacterized protein [Venturia canescens]|uniref:uncharacterized protein n=1 Tax=Venturia canescens TaxID=32260 RepID=UPI001C9C5917|nr:uncharacterized protein LOC122418412 [Venturia canescens]